MKYFSKLVLKELTYDKTSYIYMQMEGCQISVFQWENRFSVYCLIYKFQEIVEDMEGTVFYACLNSFHLPFRYIKVISYAVTYFQDLQV